jgi:hypothetical protein
VALLFSDFVNLRKSEADHKQVVLLAHCPGAGKAEALAQPQHRLEPLDCAPSGIERLKATVIGATFAAFQLPINSCSDHGAELDVHQPRQSPPHDGVAGWRIMPTGKVTTHAGDLGQVVRERLSPT